MKYIFGFLAVIVIAAVVIGAIGRGAPAPVVIPDSEVRVVEAELIVSSAASGGAVEIDAETLRLLGAADEVGDLGQHALDVQAQVASDGLDTARDIAVSGYAANVAISMNGTFGMVAIVFIIFSGIALALYFLAQIGKKTERSDGGGQ